MRTSQLSSVLLDESTHALLLAEKLRIWLSWRISAKHLNTFSSNSSVKTASFKSYHRLELPGTDLQTINTGALYLLYGHQGAYRWDAALQRIACTPCGFFLFPLPFAFLFPKAQWSIHPYQFLSFQPGEEERKCANMSFQSLKTWPDALKTSIKRGKT